MSVLARFKGERLPKSRQRLGDYHRATGAMCTSYNRCGGYPMLKTGYTAHIVFSASTTKCQTDGVMSMLVQRLQTLGDGT